MNAFRIILNLGSVVLLAILGWLVVRIVLGAAQPESLYKPEPIIAPVTVASTGGSTATYNFSSDPFAFGEVALLPVELMDDAPETTLDLKLVGIVSESNATFKLPDGRDKAVKLGEEVMNGVTLTRTYLRKLNWSQSWISCPIDQPKWWVSLFKLNQGLILQNLI